MKKKLDICCLNIESFLSYLEKMVRNATLLCVCVCVWHVGIVGIGATLFFLGDPQVQNPFERILPWSERKNSGK